MRIAVLTYVTPEIESYAIITRSLNKRYCDAHGYDYIEHNPDISYFRKRSPHWMKVNMIHKYMSQYDYVVWIDSDAMIIDHSKRIEHILASYAKEETAFLICDDQPNGGFINTGGIIIKNNSLIRFFVEQWWELGETFKKATKRYHEQDILANMLLSSHIGYLSSGLVKICPVDAFNSSYDNYSEENLFVAHVMARDIEKKTEILRELREKFYRKYGK